MIRAGDRFCNVLVEGEPNLAPVVHNLSINEVCTDHEQQQRPNIEVLEKVNHSVQSSKRASDLFHRQLFASLLPQGAMIFFKSLRHEHFGQSFVVLGEAVRTESRRQSRQLRSARLLVCRWLVVGSSSDPLTQKFYLPTTGSYLPGAPVTARVNPGMLRVLIARASIIL